QRSVAHASGAVEEDRQRVQEITLRVVLEAKQGPERIIGEALRLRATRRGEEQPSGAQVLRREHELPVAARERLDAAHDLPRFLMGPHVVRGIRASRSYPGNKRRLGPEPV